MSARIAAAANAHDGMVSAGSDSLAGARSESEKPAIRTQSAPISTTAIGENPIQRYTGNATAECTAQPITEAAPSASARGKSCRARA